MDSQQPRSHDQSSVGRNIFRIFLLACFVSCAAVFSGCGKKPMDFDHIENRALRGKNTSLATNHELKHRRLQAWAEDCLQKFHPTGILVNQAQAQSILDSLSGDVKSSVYKCAEEHFVNDCYDDHPANKHKCVTKAYLQIPEHADFYAICGPRATELRMRRLGSRQTSWAWLFMQQIFSYGPALLLSLVSGQDLNQESGKMPGCLARMAQDNLNCSMNVFIGVQLILVLLCLFRIILLLCDYRSHLTFDSACNSILFLESFREQNIQLILNLLTSSATDLFVVCFYCPCGLLCCIGIVLSYIGKFFNNICCLLCNFCKMIQCSLHCCSVCCGCFCNLPECILSLNCCWFYFTLMFGCIPFTFFGAIMFVLLVVYVFASFFFIVLFIPLILLLLTIVVANLPMMGPYRQRLFTWLGEWVDQKVEECAEVVYATLLRTIVDGVAIGGGRTAVLWWMDNFEKVREWIRLPQDFVIKTSVLVARRKEWANTDFRYKCLHNPVVPIIAPIVVAFVGWFLHGTAVIITTVTLWMNSLNEKSAAVQRNAMESDSEGVIAILWSFSIGGCLDAFRAVSDMDKYVLVTLPHWLCTEGWQYIHDCFASGVGVAFLFSQDIFLFTLGVAMLKAFLVNVGSWLKAISLQLFLWEELRDFCDSESVEMTPGKAKENRENFNKAMAIKHGSYLSKLGLVTQDDDIIQALIDIRAEPLREYRNKTLLDQLRQEHDAFASMRKDDVRALLVTHSDSP